MKTRPRREASLNTHSIRVPLPFVTIFFFSAIVFARNLQRPLLISREQAFAAVSPRFFDQREENNSTQIYAFFLYPPLPRLASPISHSMLFTRVRTGREFRVSYEMAGPL